MQRRISEFLDKKGKSWPRIETEADSLTDSFVEAARGLMDLLVPDHQELESTIAVPIFCESSDLEFLLADWINTLIFEMNARSMVFTKFDVFVEGINVKGTAYGVSWDQVRNKANQERIDLQGVAFDALSVEEHEGRWKTSFVLNDRERHPLRLGSWFGLFLSSVLLLSSTSCMTARERQDIKSGVRTPLSDFSKARLVENFDFLTLARVALDGTNLCKFQNEEMMTIPNSIRSQLDAWARGLPLDEGLPTVKELSECASSCRCGHYVYWLDKKGAYPAELNDGYEKALQIASKMTNAQALACAKKVQSLCQSQTLKEYR